MAKSTKQASRFRPWVEELESRLVPAGNVAAAVVGGQLIIRGDASANALVVLGLGPGQYLLTGFARGGAATTINGLQAFLLSGVTGDFDVRLGEGNDFLVFGSGVYSGRVNVLAGGGNDTVQSSGATFTNQVNVNTGAGNDVVTFQQSFFFSSVSVQLGAGNDDVFLQNSVFVSPASFNGGAGSDRLIDLGSNLFVSVPAAADFAFISPSFSLLFGSTSGFFGNLNSGVFNGTFG